MRTSVSDLTWPQRNDRALSEAYASAPSGQRWFLVGYWQPGMSFDAMAERYAQLVEALRGGHASCVIRVRAMIAHYRTDEGPTSLEPWLFAYGSAHVELAQAFCSTSYRPIAFWGDGASTWALTPDRDRARSRWGASARSLGPFRPGAIAHAIHECSPSAAAFLGFTSPAPTFHEALLRATLIAGPGER